MPHTIIQPEGWAPAKGYANGVLTPSGILHIGGQIGWDANKEFVGDGFIEQMEQALKNIRAIVEAAGGTVEDIVRLTWFVTDKAEYMAHQREVGEAYRRVLGKHFPAMSMLVVSELVEDRAKVEIEATAELSKAG
ncbi:enamine deaminase RidA [Pararhodobacter marinus]|uniref:Enamine deaminase RidA n=1 Tax=Pararhodobacter marinus TaxID=2184063 RepID=A0A2U2CAK3_9RHOB|nr:RidA family protein [Pararhodobacter marinus]PWE28938.1 enamine deaminase RidA [Pararhodobacter marinus]